MCSTGRAATVEVWLDWFDEERRLEQYPTVAVLGAWVHLLRGRPAAAKRWLGAAERGQRRRGLARRKPLARAVDRCASCGNVPRRRRADANRCRDRGARPGRRRAGGVRRRCSCSGSHSCSSARAIAATRASPTRPRRPRAPVRPTSAMRRARRAVAARRGPRETSRGRGAGAQARALIDDGRLGEHPLSAIAFAASARQGLRAAIWRGPARISRRRRLSRPQLTHALPWYSVQTSLELGARRSRPARRARRACVAVGRRRDPQPPTSSGHPRDAGGCAARRGSPRRRAVRRSERRS